MWRLGFRPFYLGAAAFAALAVPFWLALLAGVVHLPSGVAPLLWQAHEMLFGMAAAVIVGFVLTAGRAWTGLDTTRGPMLGGLFLLWLAARLAGVLAPPGLYAVLDLALLPLVALALARVLRKARNRRNLPLVGLLALLALANAGFHAAALAGLALSQAGWLAPSAGVHALAVGATGGLVIGMVTRTARGHTGRPLKASRPELAAYGLVLAAACLRVAGPLVGPAEWAWRAAGVVCSAGFLMYLVVFTPWLLRPRLDGKDG